MLRAKIDLKRTRICSPKPFSLESLRSGERDNSDWRPFEKWIRRQFRAILSTHFVKCRQTFLPSWIPTNHIQFKFWERESFSALLYVLHKAWTLGTLRRGRAVTARKCTSKRDAHAEMLFCLLKILSVFTHVANSYANLLPQKKAFT